MYRVNGAVLRSETEELVLDEASVHSYPCIYAAAFIRRVMMDFEETADSPQKYNSLHTNITKNLNLVSIHSVELPRS